MVRIRRKAKKKILMFLIIFLIVAVVLGGCGYYFYRNEQIKIKKEQTEKLIEKIKGYYSEIIEIEKNSTLYELKDGKYIKVGLVSPGERFRLE